MPDTHDILNDIRDRLTATLAFGLVTRQGLPEDFGIGVSTATAVAIEPLRGSEQDRWDDDDDDVTLLGDGQASLTVMVRDQDPEQADDLTIRLLGIVQDALNGQPLGSITVPGKTRVSEWRWLPRRHPERRMVVQVVYQYLVPGWDRSAESD